MFFQVTCFYQLLEKRKKKMKTHWYFCIFIWETELSFPPGCDKWDRRDSGFVSLARTSQQGTCTRPGQFTAARSHRRPEPVSGQSAAARPRGGPEPVSGPGWLGGGPQQFILW